MRDALRSHWPEYLMEAAELGIFMISACAFGILLFHPSSPVVAWIPDAFQRRVLMGIAMGSTAIAIVHSPLGKQSGAHFNPSTTLTFFRLGKIEPWDALFYVVAQFAGAVAGVALVSAVARRWLSHSEVNYVVTAPGRCGVFWAFAAEVVITFILMTVVLNVSNTKKIARFTGWAAGILVASYIAFESPISGMSMNPARTFGSAFHAHVWTGLWMYFTAPPIGMLLAAEVFVRRKGLTGVLCAKYHHENDKRCIFRCNYNR